MPSGADRRRARRLRHPSDIPEQAPHGVRWATAEGWQWVSFNRKPCVRKHMATRGDFFVQCLFPANFRFADRSSRRAVPPALRWTAPPGLPSGTGCPTRNPGGSDSVKIVMHPTTAFRESDRRSGRGQYRGNWPVGPSARSLVVISFCAETWASQEDTRPTSCDGATSASAGLLGIASSGLRLLAPARRPAPLGTARDSPVRSRGY
jgi:hypothetical protein